jgi:hypothetical protein
MGAPQVAVLVDVLGHLLPELVGEPHHPRDDVVLERRLDQLRAPQAPQRREALEQRQQLRIPRALLGSFEDIRDEQVQAA